MDKQSNIVNCAEKYADYASEAFLVTLANKGLYNRALKDMASVSSCSLEADGEKLIVMFDGITVTLDPNVAKSSCSCPSRTICKHVIMALLCAAQYTGPEGGRPEPENAEAVPGAYAELKSMDPAVFKKKAGKKLYESSVEAILGGVCARFNEGDMLSAVISDDGASVYFPSVNSLEASVCKCGARGLCRHRVIAVLCYLKEKAGFILEDDEESLPGIIDKDDLELLGFAESVILNIFKKGASMCGENDMDSCAQIATRLSSDNIGNIAKLFRSLASHIENMLEKRAAFSQIDMMSVLCRIYNTITAINKNAGDNSALSSLVEGGRNRYYQKGAAVFAGLGACPWETASGFSGITAYLFNLSDKKFYTYTVTQAGYYDNTASFGRLGNLTKYYESPGNWENGVSLKDMSSGFVSLKNYKSNESLRLSSSKRTAGEITAKTTSGLLEEHGLVRKDYGEVFSEAQRASYDYFGGKAVGFPCLFRFSFIGGAMFDKTDQTLYFTITDSSGQSVPGRITHSELNSLAMEYFMEWKGGGGIMFARAFKEPGGEIYAVPVSVINCAGVNNIYFKGKSDDNR